MAKLVEVQATKEFASTFLNDIFFRMAVNRVLDAAPAADAKQVVHGRFEEWWPPKHMILTGEEKLFRCSACTAKYPDVAGFNYCPFCGKPMEPFTIF